MLKKAVNMRLSEGIDNRNNNLNSVKFIASMLVIVSHAYGFATGYIRTDWFSLITDGRGDLGALAVNIFFFYSGLLISYSLIKNSDFKRYFKRRFIRIYPAFFLVTLAITFLAAPFVTTLSLREYLTNSETYEYLKNLVFLNEHNLPGVFAWNIYGRSVNGQIWTIRIEVCCYILCYVFCKMGFLKKRRLVWSAITYLIMLSGVGIISVKYLPGLYVVIMPITMFYMGMLFAVYSERIRLNKDLMFFSVACFGALCTFGAVAFASVVFLPYTLCCVAFATDSKSGLLNFWGRFSYEIYLWGGFVAQMVVYVFGGSMSEYLNMAIVIPISMLLGMVTNRVVEAPMKK